MHLNKQKIKIVLKNYLKKKKKKKHEHLDIKGHLHALHWHELLFHVCIIFSKCSNDVSWLK